MSGRAPRRRGCPAGRRDDLAKLGFVETVEEDEGHREPHARFLEKGAERGEELAEQAVMGDNGPSAAGRGSITLCQQVKARKSAATKNKVMDQATGMLPELVRKVTAVSA